ncbi:unnamed protein product [Brachionus calyciflorus]|uniref:Uncharacterized protein n=1 Tax=Brachionus calyciflorus TaxID=104777 RepID=A0A813Q4E8_9BILA|nr:unnamed protein product [Brachionus calyciflorus]
MIAGRILNENLPKLVETEFEKCLLEIQKNVNEIEILKEKINLSRIDSEDTLKYEKLNKELLNQINQIQNNEIYFAEFRNNQTINALIINSYIILVKASKKLKIRHKSISSLVQLLNSTITKENSYDYVKWFRLQLKIFLLSIEKQLVELYNNNDETNRVDLHLKNDLVILSRYLIEFVPFNELLLLNHEIVPTCLKFLKDNFNESNIETIFKILEKLCCKLIDEISRHDLAVLLHRYKYLQIIINIREFLVYLMSGYIDYLIKYKVNLVQRLLSTIFVLKAFVNDNILDEYIKIYDTFLSILSHKIQRYDELNIEIIEFFQGIAIEIADQGIKKGMVFSGRNEVLLDMMSGIISKSVDFNLYCEKDFKLFEMACLTIESLLENRDHGISFNYFNEKYWKCIESPFEFFLLHEKGFDILRIFSGFFRTYKTDQIKFLEKIIDSLQMFIDNKIKTNSKKIDIAFQQILVKILQLIQKNTSVGILDEKISCLLISYFNFGNKLRIDEWIGSFGNFNFDFVEHRFKFIFEKNHLYLAFKDLTVKKLNVRECELPDFRQSTCIFHFISFLGDFVEIYRKNFNGEEKYQLIEFLELLWKFESWIDVKNIIENTLNILIN